MGGPLSQLVQTTVDLQTEPEVGAAYVVAGCVETSHYLGSTTKFGWPGGRVWNFVEPFSLWVRVMPQGVVVIGSAPASLCTFVVIDRVAVNMLVQGPRPEGDSAMRFPPGIANPVSHVRDGMTPAEHVRPTFDVLHESERLKLLVRAAPLPELNTKAKTASSFGEFRTETPVSKYVVRWSVERREPGEGGQPTGGGGGQSAG